MNVIRTMASLASATLLSAQIGLAVSLPAQAADSASGTASQNAVGTTETQSQSGGSASQHTNVISPTKPGTQLKPSEEIGRVEGPRDTNMFQVEPTVIDERHYTSGRAERHQKMSPTLPEGAPIPDSPGVSTTAIPGSTTSTDTTITPQDKPTFGIQPTVLDERVCGTGRAERQQKTSPTLPEGATVTGTTTAAPLTTNVAPVPTATTDDTSVENYATPLGDSRKLAGKIDATLQMRLQTEVRNEMNTFRLKLSMTNCSPAVIKQLNDLRRLRVVTVNARENEITIEAPASLVSKIVEIPEVKFISRPY